MKKRRLQDLYVVGQELTIDDGKGPVVVWLQKLNPVENEDALRRANAMRARMLISRNNEDSEEFQVALGEAFDYGNRENLVDYLIENDVAEVRLSRTAEEEAKDKWSKDGYLQGLRDAWVGTPDAPGLKDVYVENKDDPEASRVFGELKKFDNTVEAEIAGEKDRLRRDYEGMAEDDLRRKVAVRFVESRADAAWFREYARAEVYYATREPDKHKQRYFETRREVDELETAVLLSLQKAYAALKVDPLEGKDSGETEDSSPSSESPEPVVTDLFSGPLDATQ